MTASKGVGYGRRPKVSPEELMRWITWHIRTQGYAPRVVDVAAAFGVRRNTASSWMQRSEDLGYIRRGKGLSNLQVVAYARAV